MKHERIEVVAEWDPDARVWVATSEDIDGLAIEAETFERLIERLPGVLQDLIETNGIDLPAGVTDILYHVQATQTGHVIAK